MNDHNNDPCRSYIADKLTVHFYFIEKYIINGFVWLYKIPVTGAQAQMPRNNLIVYINLQKSY